MKLHEAIGTAAVAGFPIAVAGAIGYLVNGLAPGAVPPESVGFVHVPGFIGLTLTSVAMAPLGARLIHRLPTGPLKKFFALFLYLVGGKLAFPALPT